MTSAALDQLFLAARTHGHWQDRPVPGSLLRRLYELARMPPTATNSQPLRVVFVTTPEAKARLRPLLSPGNVDKTMAAPVTAILCYDLAFYDQFPTLMPHVDIRSRIVSRPPEDIARLAQQSGTLQSGYLILAARALGLDCGPMGGFDREKVDAEFLAGTQWKSNLLVNLGYADHSQVTPRRPRLEFDDACRIV